MAAWRLFTHGYNTVRSELMYAVNAPNLVIMWWKPIIKPARPKNELLSMTIKTSRHWIEFWANSSTSSNFSMTIALQVRGVIIAGPSKEPSTRQRNRAYGLDYSDYSISIRLSSIVAMVTLLAISCDDSMWGLFVGGGRAAVSNKRCQTKIKWYAKLLKICTTNSSRDHCVINISWHLINEHQINDN